MKTISSEYRRVMKPLFLQIAESPWEDKNFYAQWLAQTYHFVASSTRLINLAGAFFTDNKLHNRFIDYVKEEKNHDILLVNDLKHLGYGIRQLPEHPVTAGFYRSQAYWIMMRHPISFFGYILCLEGLAVEYGQMAHARAKASHGDKAANFLKVHAQEDIEHLQTAFKTLENVSQTELELIVENLEQCAGLYAKILQECAAPAREWRAAG